MFGPTAADTEGFLDIDEVLEAPPNVQASEFGLFRRRQRYHIPLNMTSRPRAPNIEPSVIANMELDLDLGDEDALAVEEAIAGKVEVGNREELTFVRVV